MKGKALCVCWVGICAVDCSTEQSRGARRTVYCICVDRQSGSMTSLLHVLQMFCDVSWSYMQGKILL